MTIMLLFLVVVAQINKSDFKIVDTNRPTLNKSDFQIIGQNLNESKEKISQTKLETILTNQNVEPLSYNRARQIAMEYKIGLRVFRGLTIESNKVLWCRVPDNDERFEFGITDSEYKNGDLWITKTYSEKKNSDQQRNVDQSNQILLEIGDGCVGGT